PVFLSLKRMVSCDGNHSFSRRLVNRHNTLDLASKVVCRKGARPLWIPPKPSKRMSMLPHMTSLFDGFNATCGGIASHHPNK
ncbi:MAG: hypothetical protein FWE83_08475, partial [Oscillospiraceae bacterium]|nr:hypothetical protein [Oscillospiraceae bacterium]